MKIPRSYDNHGKINNQVEVAWDSCWESLISVLTKSLKAQVDHESIVCIAGYYTATFTN